MEVYVASQIGMQLGLITRANGAALIAAGLLGVLVFSFCAMTLFRSGGKSTTSISNNPI